MTQPKSLSRLLRLALETPSDESALRRLTAELIRLGHSGDPTGKQAHVLMQHEAMRPHIAFETEADAVAYERAGKLAGSRIEVFCVDLISPSEAAPMIAARKAEARSHRLQHAIKVLQHHGLEDEDLAALGIALPAAHQAQHPTDDRPGLSSGSRPVNYEEAEDYP